jgi:hypothetical protein
MRQKGVGKLENSNPPPSNLQHNASTNYATACRLLCLCSSYQSQYTAVLYSYRNIPTLLCWLFNSEEGSRSLRSFSNDYDSNTVRCPEHAAMNTKWSEILKPHMKFLLLAKYCRSTCERWGVALSSTKGNWTWRQIILLRFSPSTLSLPTELSPWPQ